MRLPREGTFETLKSGLIRCRCKLRDGSRVSGKAMPTRAEAHASYKAALAANLQGGSRTETARGPLETPTVAEFFRQVLDGPYRRTLAVNTLELYEAILKCHIETAHLGQMHLNEVRPSHIED